MNEFQISEGRTVLLILHRQKRDSSIAGRIKSTLLIEKLWKVFHEYASNNRKFNSSAFKFFSKTLPNIVKSLMDRVNVNFCIVNVFSSTCLNEHSIPCKL